MDTEKNQFPKYDGRPYETEDVEIAPVLTFGVGMAITIIFAFWVAIPILQWIEPERPPTVISELPQAFQRQLPPEPRLQADPMKDWREFAQQEEAKVTTYKWVDLSTGRAQVPVEVAKEIVLKKGLPKPPATANPTGAENAPTN